MTGGFSVAEGTLNLTGRMANDINVASGATLAGTGFQDVGTTTIGNGATLSAGDARTAAPSIGTLTLNNLTLGVTASTVFDLGLPSIDTFAPINDLIVVAGSLDRAAADQVLELMREVNQQDGATFLICTHDESVAARCSRRLTLEDGQLASDVPFSPDR